MPKDSIQKHQCHFSSISQVNSSNLNKNYLGDIVFGNIFQTALSKILVKMGNRFEFESNRAFLLYL